MKDPAMGYIAAVLGRKGQDVTGHLMRILGASGGTKPSWYGIASPETGEFFDKSLESMPSMGSSLIAYRSSSLTAFSQQPLLQQSAALVFDGLIFGAVEPDILHVAELLRGGVAEGMRNLVSGVDGAFSAAAIEDKKIFLARDAVGTVPLYHGVNDDVIATASNMKALMAIGIEPTPVIPGTLVQLSKNGHKTTHAKRIAQTQQSSQPESRCIETLHELLTETSEDIVRKTRGGAVAFSGGIDSTLTAHYLKEAGGDLDLVCVGVGDQREYREARRAAEAMSLDVNIQPFTKEELEDSIDEIILSVEDPTPMKISVAAPLYFAAQQAVEDGHTTIFSGNGSDELFGGYYKYMKQWLTEGERVRDTMYRDVVESWRNNYDRDAKVCKDLGTRLVLPFADTRIIMFGLGVPTRYKLPSSIEEPRKIILRRLAKKLGFSAEVSDRPKKAAQYSTGVYKALTRIAKSRGDSLPEFLKRRYEELFSVALQG
jgi:asparagine synthase (glutamine-hydrolysing)